jgi:hypothetical protein
VPLAGSHFGRAREFVIKSTAGRRRVGARVGGAGSGRSGRLMPTTATIRVGRNVLGRVRIAPIGELIGCSIPSTLEPTASGQGSNSGIAGNARRRIARSQRWTRYPLFIEFHQGLIFWCPGTRKSSQRWTR